MFEDIINYIQNSRLIMIILVCIITYFVLKMFYMGEKNILEGLENRTSSIGEQLEKIQKDLNNANKNADEILHIDKYRENYENILISADELLDKSIISNLTMILGSSKNKGLNNLDIETMQNINTTIELKNNLNTIMDSLDKSSEASTSKKASLW